MYPETVRHSKALLNEYPLATETVIHRADALLHLGRPKEALACCNGVKNVPDPGLVLLRILVLSASGHPREALKLCDEELDMLEDDPDLLDLRADALDLLGRAGDARDCRERARAERVDKDPRYVLVLGD